MLTFLINETAKFLTVKSFQQCINVICVLCGLFPYKHDFEVMSCAISGLMFSKSNFLHDIFFSYIDTAGILLFQLSTVILVSCLPFILRSTSSIILCSHGNHLMWLGIYFAYTPHQIFRF